MSGDSPVCYLLRFNFTNAPRLYLGPMQIGELVFNIWWGVNKVTARDRATGDERVEGIKAAVSETQSKPNSEGEGEAPGQALVKRTTRLPYGIPHVELRRRAFLSMTFNAKY